MTSITWQAMAERERADASSAAEAARRRACHVQRLGRMAERAEDGPAFRHCAAELVRNVLEWERHAATAAAWDEQLEALTS